MTLGLFWDHFGIIGGGSCWQDFCDTFLRFLGLCVDGYLANRTLLIGSVINAISGLGSVWKILGCLWLSSGGAYGPLFWAVRWFWLC